MRVLLTGASSFTGAWFAAALAGRGHRVVAPLRLRVAAYGALERERLAMAAAAGVRLVEGVPHGGAALAELAGEGCDVIGWHGAAVGDYRRADYDIAAAVAATTAGAAAVFAAATRGGARRVIVSGSVAEPGVAQGEGAELALSPYGTAKAMARAHLQEAAARAGLAVGDFVIANPFGRLEQARFCTYLVREWAVGRVPEVRHPGYIRDNVPVPLLARCYAEFAEGDAARLGPSGIVGTQGDFAGLFAREIGERLGLPTPFELREQRDFEEPLMRVNRDVVSCAAWDEGAFWDDLAGWYRGWF